MKIFVGSFVMNYLIAGSAMGGESQEMPRQRLLLCSQIVIEHSYPAIFWDFTEFPELAVCCRMSNRVRDCHIYDWYQNHGTRELRHLRTAADAIDQHIRTD
jgi:hypothetical protein